MDTALIVGRPKLAARYRQRTGNRINHGGHDTLEIKIELIDEWNLRWHASHGGRHDLSR